MKLICPKCQAQYEIPDVAIPETGRDVQCANCDETWFQGHPGKSEAVSDEVMDESSSDDIEPASEDTHETDDTHAAQVAAAISGASVSKVDTVTETVPPRRELSPAVTDILRQEAAREQEARDANSEEAGKASLKNEHARPGRDRLPEIPDIDDSNPRLNAKSEVEDSSEIIFDVDTDPPEAVRKSGFKRGFALMLILFGLALTLYMFAPLIAQKYPSLLEPLSTYVNAVNAGRDWLNELVSGFLG